MHDETSPVLLYTRTRTSAMCFVQQDTCLKSTEVVARRIMRVRATNHNQCDGDYIAAVSLESALTLVDVQSAAMRMRVRVDELAIDSETVLAGERLD